MKNSQLTRQLPSAKDAKVKSIAANRHKKHKRDEPQIDADKTKIKIVARSAENA